MRTRIAPTVLVLTLSALTALTAPAVLMAAGFDGIPAFELRIDASLPSVSARDGIPVALAADTGEVCTLAIENFELRRILTGTGHPTPEDGPVYDARRVLDFRAAQEGGVHVAAALLVEGTAGGFDIVALTSSDLCSNWSTPVTVVGSGAAGHPVGALAALDLNASGIVALMYTNSLSDRELFLAASTDHGATWKTPLSLFASAPGSPNSLYSNDLTAVAVDSTGLICAGYVEAGSGSVRRLYTARSTDGGSSLADGNLLGSFNRGINGFGFADQSLAGRVIVFYSDSDLVSPTSGVLSIDYSGTGATEPWCAGWTPGLQRALPAEPVGQPSIAKSRASDDHLMVVQTLADRSLAITSSANAGNTWRPIATFPVEATLAHSVARTDDGSWVVAWETVAGDPDTVHLTDVEAMVSADDGATFGAATQIDDLPSGTARASLGRIAPAADDDVAIPYRQHVDGGRATDVYMETAAATALGGGSDPRIDADGAPVTVESDPTVAIASHGAGYVFVAFTAIDDGPHPDLFVARSDDGGYSFGAPLRIGHGSPGALVHREPRVAVEDNNVYVAFGWYESGTGLLHVAWRASNNLGATWPIEVEVGSFPWSGLARPYDKPNNFTTAVPSLEIAAAPFGYLYVAYNDDHDAVFAASYDGGASVGLLNANVDQSASPVRGLDLCDLGGDVLLAYNAADEHYAILSGDEGANWDPAVLVTPPGGQATTRPELNCGGAKAIVTYGTFGDGFGWRTFDSPSWLPVGTLPSPPAGFPLYTSAKILDASTFVAAFDAWDGAATSTWVTRSTDGGANFAAPVRLDPPGVGDDSGSPTVALPGNGPPEVHVYWSEQGVGSVFEPVVSVSPDAGVSWGAPLRVGQGSTCEGVLLTGLVRDHSATPTATGSLLTWWGLRDSDTGDVLVNAYDGDDLDRDGSPLASDCSPEDPLVFPGAPEIADGQDNQCPGDPGFGEIDEVPASALFANATDFTWSALPGATSYRVVRSGSAKLDTDCSLKVTATTTLTDLATPGAGLAFFYVVQAYEPFQGTFGTDSDGVLRTVPCVP